MTAEEQANATAYLRGKDQVLGEILDHITLPLWSPRKNYYQSLVGSIISQQLSTKVAEVIFARFEGLFSNQAITPKATLALADMRIRETGISHAKVQYLKHLARYTLESSKVFEQFDQMSDEEIITELVQIKGVGRWTAEMFLIFTMGRPDVFSMGDLGLKRAVQKLYNIQQEPTRKQLERIANKWKPYRSVASRYLWKSLEM